MADLDAAGTGSNAAERPEGESAERLDAEVQAPGWPVGGICPWCSVELTALPADRCPACGAALAEDPGATVPGVTVIDPEAVRRAATWERVRTRPFLRSLVEPDRGEAEESGIAPSSLEALGPPSAEVRLEMGRLRAELEAAAQREALELAALQALPDSEPAPSAQEAGTVDASLAGAADSEPETSVS